MAAVRTDRAVGVVALLLVVAISTSIPGVPRPRAAQVGQSKPVIQLGAFRDVGSLPPNATVVGALYVPLRNLDLLYYYAEQASTPGSPLYRHYLTAQEVEELFYPVSQFEQALHYVRSHGLSVLMTAADSIIVFVGQAWQVEEAFGVRIDLFTNGTLTFYSDVGPARQGPWSYPYVSNATLITFARPRFLVTLRDLAPLAGRLTSLNVSFPSAAYPMTDLATAYNATALYARGYEGQNVTVGVLDFYGDPTLLQDLAYFDSAYGLPPSNVTIVPIGPYNPDLGVATGWNYEEDLDVEAIHSMAPRARIVVYVASGSLPLSAAIAFIDQQDKVSVLGQSFGVPESVLSNLGWSFFYYNVYLSDVYYALGAAEGITFVAASGDGGGMGYSAGPIGGVAYPASSPWVLAVGGTNTYLSGGSALQTAWSAMGFVPYGQNSGGSTGGYSAVEPEPWWQVGVASKQPEGFPEGRAVPDVSANAGLAPGVMMVGEDNQTLIAGGTSEAAELTVGLLALLVQDEGSRLGLLSPSLYSVYSSGCVGAFNRVSFGYNIPWAAAAGYNLVTGLGTLNLGELVACLPLVEGSGSLAIRVYVNGNSTSFLDPGIPVNVSARIEGPQGYVDNGSFEAKLVTLYGAAEEVTMRYNSTLGIWTATLRAPTNESGVALVEVSGASGGLSGVGAVEAFVGYFTTILAPVDMYPYAPQLGLPLYILPVSPTGNLTLSVTFNATVLKFEPLNGSYEPVLSMPGEPYNLTSLRFNASPGYAVLWLSGPVYGFVPFYIGDAMQFFVVTPQVLASPGSAYPGGWVLIEGVPVPPIATMFITSGETGAPLYWSAMYGSNVTAELVAPNGTVVSSSAIPLVEGGYYEGLLWIPPGARPGYYEVLLTASYNSSAAGFDLGGVGLEEVYVAPQLRANVIVRPVYAPYGGVVEVTANITYSNGTPAAFGVFSASLMPVALVGLYENLSLSVEVPLTYNPESQLWTGTVTLPSTMSLGNATYYEGPYRGMWETIVSGMGAWGDELPYSAAYVWVGEGAVYEDVNLTTGFVTTGAVFDNASLQYDGVISWSLMEGVDKVYSSQLALDFVDSEGVIVAFDSNLTLRYSTAQTLVLIDSSAALLYSDVDQVVMGPNSSIVIVHSRVGKTMNVSEWESSRGWPRTNTWVQLSRLRPGRPYTVHYGVQTSPATSLTQAQVPANSTQAVGGPEAAHRRIPWAWILLAAAVASVVAYASSRRRAPSRH